MPAPISIIIPTLDAAPHLPETLARVMEGVAEGVVCELVISDGGSSDDVMRLAEEVGAVFVTGDAGRGGQLRRGALAAKGDWLLFLHADTWLPEGWAAAALAQLTTPDKAMAFSLSFRAEGIAPRVIARGANLRSRILGLPYGDQGLLISRPLYDRAGGHPDWPLMEDVALARALKGRLTISPLSVQTSPERYQARGWYGQAGRNLWRLLRFHLGADPQALARGYSRR